jgi:hypothetical protein
VADPFIAPVAAVAPDAHAALARAWAAARDALDAELFETLRRRVDLQLGAATGPEEEAHGELAAAALALADQFVLYVPAVGEEHLAPLRARLGDDALRTLVEALYVLDQAARLRLAHARLFEPGELPPAPPPRDRSVSRVQTWSDQASQAGQISSGQPPAAADRGTRLRTALSDLHAEAMRLDRLDPLTTELVRLRCADYHDCAT